MYDAPTRDELVQRIHSLNKNSTAAWGKMTVYQMTKHNTIWNDWVLGKTKAVYRPGILGMLFGKMALKSNTTDDRPIGKNMPAGKAFTVKQKEGDLKEELFYWAEQIKAYEHFSNDTFIHSFFGKMTKEQIGIFAYKHNDHHLRQFGV